MGGTAGPTSGGGPPARRPSVGGGVVGSPGAARCSRTDSSRRPSDRRRDGCRGCTSDGRRVGHESAPGLAVGAWRGGRRDARSRGRCGAVLGSGAHRADACVADAGAVASVAGGCCARALAFAAVGGGHGGSGQWLGPALRGARFGDHGGGHPGSCCGDLAPVHHAASFSGSSGHTGGCRSCRCGGCGVLIASVLQPLAGAVAGARLGGVVDGSAGMDRRGLAGCGRGPAAEARPSTARRFRGGGRRARGRSGFSTSGVGAIVQPGIERPAATWCRGLGGADTGVGDAVPARRSCTRGAGTVVRGWTAAARGADGVGAGRSGAVALGPAIAGRRRRGVARPVADRGAAGGPRSDGGVCGHRAVELVV